MIKLRPMSPRPRRKVTPQGGDDMNFERVLAVYMLDPSLLFTAADIARQYWNPGEDKELYTQQKDAIYHYGRRHGLVNSEKKKGNAAAWTGDSWQAHLNDQLWNLACDVFEQLSQIHKKNLLAGREVEYWYDMETSTIVQKGGEPQTLIRLQSNEEARGETEEPNHESSSWEPEDQTRGEESHPWPKSGVCVVRYTFFGDQALLKIAFPNNDAVSNLPVSATVEVQKEVGSPCYDSETAQARLMGRWRPRWKTALSIVALLCISTLGFFQIWFNESEQKPRPVLSATPTDAELSMTYAEFIERRRVQEEQEIYSYREDPPPWREHYATWTVNVSFPSLYIERKHPSINLLASAMSHFHLKGDPPEQVAW